MDNPAETDPLYQSIRELVQDARQQVQRQINSAMVQTYWHIGRLIIEHEQQGEHRAAYGKQQLEQLASRLGREFGKGFDARNLRNMRAFYLTYPIWNAVRTELGWTHHRVLLPCCKLTGYRNDCQLVWPVLEGYVAVSLKSAG